MTSKNKILYVLIISVVILACGMVDSAPDIIVATEDQYMSVKTTPGPGQGTAESPQVDHNTEDLANPVVPSALPTMTFTDTPTPTHTLSPTPDTLEGVANIIGYSVAGRPLEVYRFGNGPHKRMVIAGIHGGYEWNTINLANEMIDHLLNTPGIIPQDITLFVMPALNPDGYFRSSWIEGRSNDNNVDLNRNWDHNWMAEWNTSGCWNYLPITGGEYPESEPEVLALKNFLLSHDIEALISYHSAALGIFTGLESPGYEPAVDLALKIKSNPNVPYAYPPKASASNCETSGFLAHWATAQGIAALDIELTNHGDTDFTINVNILDEFLTWQKP